MLVFQFMDKDKTSGRIVPCALVVVLLFRLALWRVLETLPPADGTLQSIWSRVFLTFEMPYAAANILFFIVIARTVNRSHFVGETLATKWDQSALVAIFIATYNEEKPILERTIVGALAQDYPNTKTFVLDDGRRDWLRQFCTERDVHYVTRADNAHAKAGNMNAGMRFAHANGIDPEFIAILDADFVPQPDFVRRALALFEEPSTGCVQTPQHFFNPDPLQHSFGAGHLWPDEQRLFFDIILPSKDAWGVAFSCGTSSVCRVRALEEIGGFPTESVTEDMLLSVKLRSIGWQTVYLNERLSMGLAPEGLKEYVTQRGRWCLGFMQILRSPWGLFGKNASLIEKISMIDAFLYWALSFPYRILCIMVPIVYAFFGAAVMEAPLDDFASYILPAVIAQLSVLTWITRGRCLPVLSDATQLLCATSALKATFIGLFGSRNQKFKVTAKGGDRNSTIVQWNYLLPFFGLIACTVAGLLFYALTSQNRPIGNGWEITWIVWAYYNIAVLTILCFTCIELPRPSDELFRTEEQALIRDGNNSFEIRLSSISPMRARVDDIVDVGIGSLLGIQSIGFVPIQRSMIGSNITEFYFDLTPEQRDLMILKLFSGRYKLAPEESLFRDVVIRLLARLVR